MRIMVFGSSGFIGQELVPFLLNAGHELTLISRRANFKGNFISKLNNIKTIQMNAQDPKEWKNKDFIEKLNQSEGIINLAGEPIAEKRWDINQCKEIRNSRIKITQNLVFSMKNMKKKPKVLINGSAIGYYGTSQNQIFMETSSPGKDFLSNVCQEWEDTAFKKPNATRVVIFRIGIVLGPNGGALGKMLPIFNAGFGGPIGNGSQWMSWIHRSDLCEMILHGLTNKSWSGAINAVAPNPVKMKEFTNILSKKLNRPNLIRVPAPILKLILGDGAKVVLEGQKVSSIKVKELGFQFKYPDLNHALSFVTN